MNRIYVDIDTQIDFLDRQIGALFVPNADKLVPNLQKLVQKAVADSNSTLFIGSLDSHTFACGEFVENGGPFPRHCVSGTIGQLKLPELMPDRALVLPNCGGFEPYEQLYEVVAGDAQLFLFEKNMFSIFENERAEELVNFWTEHVLKTRPSDVEVIIFGVATEFCVRAAAVEFRERGYRVRVVRDAIAGVTVEGEAAAFQEFWDKGIDTVWTAEVVGEAKVPA